MTEDQKQTLIRKDAKLAKVFYILDE